MSEKSLLERVEAASGPDREIDDAIRQAFGHVIPWSASFTDDVVRIGDQLVCASASPRPTSSGSYHLPRYTASLDAARALVERVLPGWLWMVASADPPNRLPARVEFWTGDEEVRASAATPALALLAALLKATPERSDV